MLKKIVLICTVALILTTAHYVRLARLTLKAFESSLATKDRIINHNDTGLSLYDRNDQLFFSFYEAKTKQFVPLTDISPAMRQAVVAIEDKNFTHHFGFSPQGITRAAVLNLTEGQIVAGGSTITQQLVKNTLLTPQKSFRRKFQELVLAVAIEQKYSKEDILEMYLNSVYFGQGAFGVEQAAQTYFNTTAKDLTLNQASYLAAIMPAPSELASSDNLQSVISKRRQALVLDAMFNQNMITPTQRQSASKSNLVFQSPPLPQNAIAPHFALYVRDQLIKQFGEQAIVRSGYKIKTTIDLSQQQYAQQVVTQQVGTLTNKRAHNGAAVIIDPPTGHILAMVGSIGWSDPSVGKINMAVSPRQPGSSFKPLVYATAFENRLATPATLLHDEPQTFGKDYRPQNYDGRFRGPVIARRALINSLNVPAVELINRIGPSNVVKTAQDFGITSLTVKNDSNLSLALGSSNVSLLEMTGAYATFANQGYYQPPTAIINITDRDNHIIQPEIGPTKPHQAISAATAYQIANILSDSKTRTQVFGPSLNTSIEAAVKTGTTQSYRDAWTLGFTPNLAVGVWVGNNDNTPMFNAPGLTAAGPAWKNLIEQTTTQLTNNPFEAPSSVIALSVCPWNGLPYTGPGQVGYTEYFKIGTEPTGKCTPKPPEEQPNPSPEPTVKPNTAQLWQTIKTEEAHAAQ